MSENNKIVNRFRGFLPVVVDVETGGFDHRQDALLEIAAIILEMDEHGKLYLGQHYQQNVMPFPGSNINPRALEITGIDPDHPFRDALEEKDALARIFSPVRKALKKSSCQRAILVGHNAAFDLNFLNSAVARSGIQRNPFHPFSTFDTVSLAGLAYGQTVLAKAVQAAKIEWQQDAAHSALYDAGKTAELFCKIVNQWQFPMPEDDSGTAVQ